MTQITVELDPAREVMYDELVEQFGEEPVEATIRASVSSQLTRLYDNQDDIEEPDDE